MHIRTKWWQFNWGTCYHSKIEHKRNITISILLCYDYEITWLKATSTFLFCLAHLWPDDSVSFFFNGEGFTNQFTLFNHHLWYACSKLLYKKYCSLLFVPHIFHKKNKVVSIVLFAVIPPPLVSSSHAQVLFHLFSFKHLSDINYQT